MIVKLRTVDWNGGWHSTADARTNNIANRIRKLYNV
jgi:hypothetical protein